jgi:hypothetical protein
MVHYIIIKRNAINDYKYLLLLLYIYKYNRVHLRLLFFLKTSCNNNLLSLSNKYIGRLI